ncbi:MAG TPA: aminotransferase class V-fold PLP-dependent enzyme [Acetobacteraceae bacterium]|nr:aminotransferase class V-fold PLP-dependent enzyme [Acetobacteraceae bacterium]
MSGYFLYHSIGTFPGKEDALRDELARFAAFWSRPDDAQWPTALALRQDFIDRWRALIDAPAGTLTTAENVTAGLYSVIGALPARHLRGRRLLVAEDCFPSLHFLLAELAHRFGFRLDTVKLRPGATYVRDEDFVAHWQDDVGVALLTWVTSTASHRCDAAALVEHGHRMGSLVGVDITQGVGLLPFSVTCDADFVVSTSLKWLCGVPGAGIIYIAPSLLADCQPEFRGWFSQENPFSWDLTKFRFADDARRFDHGTPSIVSAAASLPGLRWLEGTGIDTVRAHNRALNECIIAHARERGWTIASPLSAEQRGGSMMLALPPHTDASAVVAALRSRHLYCDARGTTLRLSPGVVTSADDVGALCTALDELLARP